MPLLFGSIICYLQKVSHLAYRKDVSLLWSFGWSEWAVPAVSGKVPPIQPNYYLLDEGCKSLWEFMMTV